MPDQSASDGHHSPAEDPLDGVCDSDRDRRFRRLAPAITPISAADVAAGLAGHRRGTGREAFLNDITEFLGATSTGTYTSFRRAFCACLSVLSEADDADRNDVLIPAFCSADFPEALDGAGLCAVRYDIDPDSLALDSELLTEPPGDDTLALVAVNVLGYSSEMERIEAYCETHDIYLIEALGYGIGSAYRGNRLGTFGDCSVLNFQQGKPIPVGGGMVASRNEEVAFTDDGREPVSPNVTAVSGYAALGHPRAYYLYSRVKALRDRVTESTARHSTHPESKFDVPYAPPFATISDFQATIASRVFERIERDRRQRERTANEYATELADCPHVGRIRPVDGLTEHQHVRYPLTVGDPDLRDQIAAALSTAGVASSVLYDWPPIDADRFPGAARLQHQILTLPTHPYVDAADRRRILRTIRTVAENAGE